MSALIPRRAVIRLPFDVAVHIIALLGCAFSSSRIFLNAIIKSSRQGPSARFILRPRPSRFTQLATERELNEFLKGVERRAFKRALYHVRNEESALDIVQDSMMKLAIRYGERSESELHPLFQRILSNGILDWFRRQKTHNALISNFSDMGSGGDEEEDFDLLEVLLATDNNEHDSAENQLERNQTLLAIEIEIKELPLRQREAFLLRYWEDLDVAETAEAMGCTTGSVKTHCFRAIQSLAKALLAKGIKL